MWREYFNNLLNIDVAIRMRSRSYKTVKEFVTESSLEEFKEAIDRFENNNAPENDAITMECITYGGDKLHIA